MPAYDSIIFDLDGTIWDSRHAVAEARNNVIRRLGLPLKPFTVEEVQKSMGLTLEKVYELSFSSIPKEEYLEMRKHLEPEMTAVILSQGAILYPRVEETLKALASRLPLFLVSNCSVSYLAAYMKWSGHSGLFKDTLCNGENGLPKANNIKLIMNRNGLKKPVYIGDTAGDHRAANEAEIDYVHANYGFGEPVTECSRIDEFSELKALVV